MKSATIAECEDLLRKFTYGSSQINEKGFTTKRTQDLADAVGNPEKEMKVVHLAGTSGKTSTAYFMASLLHMAGKKVGLTVSPHIVNITERSLINGDMLPETQYVKYFNEYMGIVRNSGIRPSYYEYMLVFALWVFAREQVDYAVVETGLGGLYDSSNICTQPNKVCILTDIGFDHQQFLGSSLAEIASQKAGIIWPGNHVFMYEQVPEVMDVVQAQTKEQGAHLHIQEAFEADEQNSTVTFQQRNWGLAYDTYLWLSARDDLPALDHDAQNTTQHIQVPARMEEFSRDGKVFVIDGAHNEQKMRTFFESFVSKYGPNHKPVVILSLKKGKDLEAIAPLVAEHASRVIATRFSDSQDLPFGAQPPEEIAHVMGNYDVFASTATSVTAALHSFMESDDTFCLVIGSLHSAAEARAELVN